MLRPFSLKTEFPKIGLLKLESAADMGEKDCFGSGAE